MVINRTYKDTIRTYELELDDGHTVIAPRLDGGRLSDMIDRLEELAMVTRGKSNVKDMKIQVYGEAAYAKFFHYDDRAFEFGMQFVHNKDKVFITLNEVELAQLTAFLVDLYSGKTRGSRNKIVIKNRRTSTKFSAKLADEKPR